MLTQAVFTASFGLSEGDNDWGDGPRGDMNRWLAKLLSEPQSLAGTRYRVTDIRSVSVHEATDGDYLMAFALAGVEPYDTALPF